MTIIEYTKQEFQKLKEKSPKERWSYFWDYYKWHTLVMLLVISVLVQGVVTIVNHKDTVFQAVLLNTNLGSDGSAFSEQFHEYANISDKEKAVFNTGIILSKEASRDNTNAFQTLVASITLKDVDTIAGPAEPFAVCAYSAGGMLADLRNHLDADTLTRLADRLYYIDGAVLEQLNGPVGTTTSAIAYPDPRKPDTMKDPIPVGIDISDRESLRSTYYPSDSVLYIGIAVNTMRPETAVKFIEYLWS